MAINDLSPAFVRLVYTVGNTTHVQVLPTKFTGTLTPGLAPDLLAYSGDAIPFGTGLTAYCNVIRPLFSTAASFLFAEAWSKPTPTDDPLFLFQQELGILGTNAGNATAYLQLSTTFRTQFGGLYRSILLETSLTANIRDDFPFANTTIAALRTYLLGATSWVYGRDNGKLVAAIRYITKTNDVLRKRGLLNIS